MSLFHGFSNTAKEGSLTFLGIEYGQCSDPSARLLKHGPSHKGYTPSSKGLMLDRIASRQGRSLVPYTILYQRDLKDISSFQL